MRGASVGVDLAGIARRPPAPDGLDRVDHRGTTRSVRTAARPCTAWPTRASPSASPWPGDLRIDPREFDRIGERLGDRVVHVGHLDLGEYHRLLASSDVTVSTAEHETFGIAAVEAMAAGCVPLLPNRLSYPEIVPSPWHEAVLYEEATCATGCGRWWSICRLPAPGPTAWPRRCTAMTGRWWLPAMTG